MALNDQEFLAQIEGGMGNAPADSDEAFLAGLEGGGRGTAAAAPRQPRTPQPTRFFDPLFEVEEGKKGIENVELMDFARAAGNYLPSLMDNVAGVVSAFANPVESIKAMASLGSGMYKLGKGKTEGDDVKMVLQAWEAMKVRYGDNLRETMVEDPAGIMLDLVSILAPVAGVAGKVGLVSKTGRAAGLASAARKVADLPATLPMGIVKAGIKAPRTVAERILPQVFSITSGKAAPGIRQMFRGGGRKVDFDGQSVDVGKSALRGGPGTEGAAGLPKDFLVQELERGIRYLENKRGAEYRKALKETDFKAGIDLDVLKKEIYDAMEKQWGVKVKRAKGATEGPLQRGRNSKLVKLDFIELGGGSTPLAKGAKKRFRQIITDVEDAGNPTLKGVDDLNMRLDVDYGRGQTRNKVHRQSNALLNQVRGRLMKKVMADKDLGPAKRSYSVQSDVLDEITTMLSGGSKNNETIMRKIIGSLEGEDMSRVARRDLIQYIDDVAGTHLMDAASGGTLSSILPTGIHARETAYKATGFLTAGAYISPVFWLGLPFSSPRVVGEFMRALGIPFKQTEKVANWLKNLPGAGAVGPGLQGARRGGTIADVVLGLLEQGEELPQAPLVRIFNQRPRGTNVGGEDNLPPEEPVAEPQSIGQRVLGGP